MRRARCTLAKKVVVAMRASRYGEAMGNRGTGMSPAVARPGIREVTRRS
ncbi:hypothetical protein [Rhizohabitans arisaemae]|nr:hypothetical protein [Rhizohabitans arisaemae]